MHESVHLARTFSDQNRDNSEREALYYLLRQLKLPQPFKKKLEACRAQYGDLTIAAWHEAFPNFPILLLIKPAEKMKDFTRLDKFFGAARGSKIIREFLQAMEIGTQFAAERSTGVLIKLPYVADWCIVHNSSVIDRVPSSVMIRIPVGQEGCLSIETLPSFLDAWQEPLKGYFQGAVDITG